MSRTLRLKKYENGKPVYTRHENKEPRYRWYRHELPEIRREFNRSKRMKQKSYFKKFREIPCIKNTNGWLTN